MTHRMMVRAAGVVAAVLAASLMAAPAYADHTWAADDHAVEAYGGDGGLSEGSAGPIRRTSRITHQHGYTDVSLAAGGGIAVVDADGTYQDPGGSIVSGAQGFSYSRQYVEIDGPPGEVLVRLRAQVSGTSKLMCGLGAHGCRLSSFVKVFVRSNTAGGQRFTGLTDAFLDQAGTVTVQSAMSGVSISNPSAGVMVFRGEVTTDPIPVHTNEPFFVQLDAGFSTAMAEAANASVTGLHIGFAKTGPVFDLPPGYAAHSTSIVENEWRNPFNVGPQALDDAATTFKGSTITVPVLSNDADGEGSPLSLASVAVPSHGSAVINADGTIDYTPNAGFAGTDSFSYTVSDPEGATDTANVSVTVLNRAPSATPDELTTSKNVTAIAPVLANDVDADGDALQVEIITPPAHGLATPNADGTISYTPATGYVGADSLEYRVNDGMDTDTATLQMTVVDDSVAPAVTARRTGPGTIEIIVADTGSGIASITPTSATPNAHVVVPAYAPGAPSVVITVSTNAAASAGAVRLRTVDRSGNERDAVVAFSPATVHATQR